MARPVRNDIDYYPHPVSHGKKMSYIEKKHGNDGYAVWFKILEELGSSNYHYLDLSDEVQIMFLSDRCLVAEDVLISIINDLIRLKEFDEKLWTENKILFNEKFVESIKDAYKKRSNICVNKKSLLTLLHSLGIRKLCKSNSKPLKSSLKGSENPQRKEKDRIEKKRRGDENARAIDFLKNNFTSRFEQEFEMRYKNKIKDYKKFENRFNNKVDVEKLEFDDRILFARLNNFVDSWLDNQKNDNNEKDNQSSAPKRF